VVLTAGSGNGKSLKYYWEDHGYEPQPAHLTVLLFPHYLQQNSGKAPRLDHHRPFLKSIPFLHSFAVRSAYCSINEILTVPFNGPLWSSGFYTPLIGEKVEIHDTKSFALIQN